MMIMTSYANLEQRMAQGYIDMLPPFVPDENASVSVVEQEDFYGMIQSLFRLAFDEPLLFVTVLHEDDAFPTRYKKSYGKPKLITEMRIFTKTMDGLLDAMFHMGQGVDVKLTPKQKTILARLGLEDRAALPAAWKWMSTKDGASVTTFSHCLFDENYPYASDIYAGLLGESAFRKLEDWMLARGYQRFATYRPTASDCNLALSIVNPAWGETPPRGGFEYKILHTGIAAQYEYYAQKPVIVGLCIPNGMKPYLAAFDAMDTTLQAFVVDQTKKCDGCKYCVQTDKTGSRPLANTTISWEGKEYKLCHLFPGYRYNWSSVDDDLVEKLIKMLSFMDGFVQK